MAIETSDVDVQLTNTLDHLVGEYLIHNIGIYWLSGEWMNQEDYRTTLDLDLSDEETPTGQPKQPVAQTEASQVPNAPPFGLAHLDAMEKRLMHRMDVGFQVLNDRLDSELMSMYDRWNSVSLRVSECRSPEQEVPRPSEKFRISPRISLEFLPERELARLSEEEAVEAVQISPGRESLA
ncbi:hypothetical protein Lal_00039651 [Lupinus albus]|nr:hypothetical protein Lal_00039651 [Lupinus albus]